MLRKEQEPDGETRNFIYDVDNDGVIFANAPQLDDASKKGWHVDAVIPERI